MMSPAIILFLFADYYKYSDSSSMVTNNRIKLKSTLACHTQCTVDLASWLDQRGVSYYLLKHYYKNGWMESVGIGALKLPDEEVRWQGGLFNLQGISRIKS